jgi:hypothetical protein
LNAFITEGGIIRIGVKQSAAISRTIPFSRKMMCIYETINLKRRMPMGEVVHTPRIRIVRETGPTRRAMIDGFSEPIYYGVHGGIRRFYKIDPDKEHAATLDHIVAATAG